MALKSSPTVRIPTASAADGFRRVKTGESIRRRLIVLAQGTEKTGKTHFALTAPGPIYFQSFNLGTEGVIERPNMPWSDTEIWLKEYSLVGLADGTDLDAQAHSADKIWQDYLKHQFEATRRGATAIIDTEDEVWELFRVARSGTPNPQKQSYLEISPEYRRTLNAFIESDCNLIMVEKMKEEWVANKSTGKMKRRGFKDAGYAAQVIVETWKRKGEYGMTVLDCRINPAIEGMEMPNDFNTLMELVWS